MDRLFRTASLGSAYLSGFVLDSGPIGRGLLLCRRLVAREDHRHHGRPAAAWEADEGSWPGDVVITPAVDHLSRDTTDVLVIARDMQRAGAGIRLLAEPFLYTTSDFAEIIFTILRVAAKLERRRILQPTARRRADAKADEPALRSGNTDGLESARVGYVKNNDPSLVEPINLM